MKRRVLLTLFGAALAIPGAALTASSNPVPLPLCRVRATYTPLTWPWWTPAENRFRRITVSLRPGCPEGGLARVRLTNLASGRTLPERGGYYTITPDDPDFTIPFFGNGGVMPQWAVYWIAESGKPYLVRQEYQ